MLSITYVLMKLLVLRALGHTVAASRCGRVKRKKTSISVGKADDGDGTGMGCSALAGICRHNKQVERRMRMSLATNSYSLHLEPSARVKIGCGRRRLHLGCGQGCSGGFSALSVRVSGAGGSQSAC